VEEGIEEVAMQTPVIEAQVYQDAEEEEVPSCRHHWVIESPHGATSLGTCKVCGEEREFQNSAQDTLWEGDPMRSISRMGGGNRPVVKEKAPSAAED
jgi:hypothetical protein